MSREAIDLQHELTLCQDHWSPRTVAEYNGHDVMVVKVQGARRAADRSAQRPEERSAAEHRHPEPDHMFIVPKGVTHRPRAVSGEVHVLLIEPTGTPNSGDVKAAALRRVI